MTEGLVMSEAVMMGLGPHIGRDYAHDLVYDLCRQAIAEKKPLLERLAAHPEIARHVDRKALEDMLDPANHLGQSGYMVDRLRWPLKRIRGQGHWSTRLRRRNAAVGLMVGEEKHWAPGGQEQAPASRDRG